jgi:RHS repeat-associated protein
MATNGNTFGESSIKGNKRRPFKTRWLSKSAIHKLQRSRRILLVLAALLLASSAAALTSLAIWRAMQSGNAAAFVSQSVPATMTAGQAYAVTVTMLNQGTTTWTPGQAYRLGSQNPQDNTTWVNPNRVNLLPGDSVSPGATTTFSFVVTAPSNPGSYNFQWRMVQDGVGWFGALTPNVAVQVVPGPATTIPPITKLTEYVHAGGRLITSEEKSCVPTFIPGNGSSLQAGGTGSFDVSIPSGCIWSATTSANWITVTSGASGVGSGTVSYFVAANGGPQRLGTITVNGIEFNITQAPNSSACIYTLDTPGVELSEQAGSGPPFTLTTGGGCPWTATSNAAWLTVTPSSGSSSATFNYSVTANGGQQRTGVITVGGKTFTVTQKPNQAFCTFALSPSSTLISVGGGSAGFNVMTGAGCIWNASTNDGWITFTGGISGTGIGPVSFNAQANNGGPRTGSISVRGQAFTITQCGYAVSPTFASFNGGGGTGSITVSAAEGCPSWSATSNVEWIHITSGANGAGNGAVNYSVGGISDPCSFGRSGSITVAGRTVSIGQSNIVQPCIINPSCCEPSAMGAESRGLTARYFSNTRLSGQPTLQRVDPVVNFNWAGASPDKLLPANDFSARWNAQLAAPSSEAYTFYLLSDGGARLWVNDRLVIDRWQPPFEPLTQSAPVDLKAEAKADVRVEYYNAGQVSAVYLLWSSASTPRQIIPRCYLYPATTANESTPSDTGKQTGMLLPPGSDADPNSMQPQHGVLSRWPASQFGRAGLALLIACGLFALLLRLNWSRARGKFAMAFAGVVSRLRGRIAWLGSVMGLGKRMLAGLLLLMARTIARRALALWRSSGAARLRPILRRALIIALIVRLAAPVTPAEAAGIVRAAQAAWREARAYVGAVANSPANMAPVGRSGMAASAATQTQQVADLQVCPRQLVMFAGERYTLTPIALDGSQQVVHGVGMSWSSRNSSVAGVSSFGQVEAVAVGITTVDVQCGGASEEITIDVRGGTRPIGSNQEADIDTSDCASEQAAMYAPQSAVAAQQNLLDAIGVQSDWDPEPEPNSRATHFRNAVGNPRFGAQRGSDNYQFNVPVVNAGGRGVSAGIGMTLNSRVWNTDNGKLTFNYVGANPAPGWTIGYGKIIRNYNATATGNGSGIGSGNSPGDYLLVSSDGTRVRLATRYEAATDHWLHESDDGSFLQFDMRNGEMRYTDGAKTIYSSVNGCLLPTAMIGSNGGAITMTYRDYCEGASCVRVFRHRTALSAVRDTMGRYVTFHYYGDIDYTADPDHRRPAGELAAIKAPDLSGVQQEVIRVEYQPIFLNYNFGSIAVDAPANNSVVQVVRSIYYPQTGRGFLFLDYSSYGMPRNISTRMGMTGPGGAITDGEEIAYTKYYYTTINSTDPYDRHHEGSLSDSPQFDLKEEWWQGKTKADGEPATTPTRYEYSRKTVGTTEVSTLIYVEKKLEVETTTETDSSKLGFGKPISIEHRNSETKAVLGRQVLTYVAGPDGEVEPETVETIDEAERGTFVRFRYGRYGRVTDMYECGYKQGGDYQVRRRFHYDYHDVPSYEAARFLRLVSRQSVYDAKNNNNDADDELKAKTEITYDDYSAMGGIEDYGLTPNLYPPNHDAAYDQDRVMRGNVTAVKTFSELNPDKSTTRGVGYDIFGNVVKADVSCCVKKTFRFSSLTAYSKPDWVRSGDEAALNLQTSYKYNFFTGLLERETNPDGFWTEYEYDPALRLKRVNSQIGVESVTQFEQDSNGNDQLAYISKISYNDRETQKVITSKQWFNGAGHVIRAGTGTGVAPDNYDMTATVYDGCGRVAKRSNPYLGDADGARQAGVTQYWTVTTYDELSRVRKVTLPDEKFIRTDYFGATATGGATVITTDTVGRQRKSQADGFGRLVKMIEQNPANGNLEWETIYNYDVLDNLIQIDQGGQLRTFTYDAQSRLRIETTPETGKTEYTYTDFDAVKTRKDARNVETTYTYGALNLPTGVSYNNVSGVAVTAPLSIHYKGDSPGKGRLESVTDGVGFERYDYDNFGRLQLRTREIDSVSYQTRYEYNALGQMTQMIYPSGKRVKLGRDARGRLSALERVDTSGTAQEPYLSGINYRVDGMISSLTLGDGATEAFGYSNDRLQLTSQRVTKGGNTLLDLSYGYGAAAGQMGSQSTPGNSGHLVSVTGTIDGQIRSQAFTYDNVGRLLTAKATGWGPWERRFEYDRHGNRTAVFNAISGGGQLQNTAIELLGGMKTNRIANVNGTLFRYDANGNRTEDGARTYTFDAENRMVSVSGPGAESYGYDARSRRVKKVAGGVVTHYIWEGPQVIAEYERGGSAQAKGTRYYHPDRLSTRVITNSAGAVVGTTDHFPFGEEIGATGQGEKHKFTNYERDTSGNDYAMNRHYDSRQGRFNQADPLGIGASSLTDPQSLNLYSYAQNDPINFNDPTGLRNEDLVPMNDPGGDIRSSGSGGGGPGSPIRGCSVQYSFAQCGGWGGIMGGGFGDSVAEHDREYGGLSATVADALREHNERVGNAFIGRGFITNAEVEETESEPGQQDWIDKAASKLKGVIDKYRNETDWDKATPCLIDAFVNLALGVGLAAAGPVGAVIGGILDITGTDINIMQGKPLDVYGGTDLAAGMTDFAKGAYQGAYKASGGDAELKAAKDDWYKRSLKYGAWKQADDTIKNLKPLKNAVRVLGPLAIIAELADFGITSYNCLDDNKLKK